MISRLPTRLPLLALTIIALAAAAGCGSTRYVAQPSPAGESDCAVEFQVRGAVADREGVCVALVVRAEPDGPSRVSGADFVLATDGSEPVRGGDAMPDEGRGAPGGGRVEMVHRDGRAYTASLPDVPGRDPITGRGETDWSVDLTGDPSLAPVEGVICFPIEAGNGPMTLAYAPEGAAARCESRLSPVDGAGR